MRRAHGGDGRWRDPRGARDVHEMTARLLEAIPRERAVRPFRDLTDFLRRTRAEVKGAESLIRIGALDGLGITEAGGRPRATSCSRCCPRSRRCSHGRAAPVTSAVPAPAPVRPAEDLAHLSGWRPARRFSAELELVGLSLTDHPLALAAADLETRGVTWARDLRELPDRTKVRVCGVRERAQTPRPARASARASSRSKTHGAARRRGLLGHAQPRRRRDREAPRVPDRRRAAEQLRAGTRDRGRICGPTWCGRRAARR